MPSRRWSFVYSRVIISLLHFSASISAARFDGFIIADNEVPTISTGTILVGPADPPTQCRPLFGQPDRSDCNHMLQHYLGLPDNDDEDVETISEVLIGAWATRVTQFLGPGASAEDAPGSTWPLPSTSITDLEYPHCQITLMTTTMPGTTNTDSEELTTTDATWFDVYHSTNDVLNECVSAPEPQISSGGYHILGEHNKLAVFVYNPNSEFKDAIDLEAGCVRRGRDKIYNMLNRFGFFAPACAANSEGAGAGSSSSGACLSNIAQIANILYGLRREGQNTVVRWCQQTITSMEITS